MGENVEEIGAGGDRITADSPVNVEEALSVMSDLDPETRGSLDAWFGVPLGDVIAVCRIEPKDLETNNLPTMAVREIPNPSHGWLPDLVEVVVSFNEGDWLARVIFEDASDEDGEGAYILHLEAITDPLAEQAMLEVSRQLNGGKPAHGLNGLLHSGPMFDQVAAAQTMSALGCWHRREDQ